MQIRFFLLIPFSMLFPLKSEKFFCLRGNGLLDYILGQTRQYKK
jgi:hypothetical protein